LADWLIGDWQDPCVEQSDGQLCGVTPHLTSFAILLTGGGNNGQFTDECTRNYITGSSGGDLALAGSVAGAVLLIVVVVVLVSYTTFGRRLVSGRQGVRATLREMRAKSSNNSDFNSSAVECSVEPTTSATTCSVFLFNNHQPIHKPHQSMASVLDLQQPSTC
jgi:hypothetical protein